MALYRHDRWYDLLGAFVEVRLNDSIIRYGRVDDVMPDSSAAWIASDGCMTRVIVEAAEGHQLWVEPAELEASRLFG